MGFRVESPSIFVDSDIINVGRVNNTLAHECYHWWRHRNYFNFKRVHEQSTEFGIRCDKHMRKNVEKGRWTDVERMEWQARTIAPKILMPRTATKKKVDSLYRELTQGTGLAKDAVTETLIAKLADFLRYQSNLRLYEWWSLDMMRHHHLQARISQREQLGNQRITSHLRQRSTNSLSLSKSV